MSAETIGSAAADADAAPLDLLLTDAALGVLNRVNPGGSGLRLAAASASRPRMVASRTRNLLGELTRIAAGTSQIAPSRRDRRFTDPGWAGNPLLRRVLQGYLAKEPPRTKAYLRGARRPRGHRRDGSRNAACAGWSRHDEHPGIGVSVAETFIGEVCQRPRFAESGVQHLRRMTT